MKRVINLARDLPIASPCPKVPCFAAGALSSHCHVCRKDVHLIDASRPQQLAALRSLGSALCVAYAVAAPVLLGSQQALAQDADDNADMEVVYVTGGGIGAAQLESLFAEVDEELTEPAALQPQTPEGSSP
jgi:UDP-N-acetylglucosamine:LPS N-acetylglucosamine transferase